MAMTPFLPVDNPPLYPSGKDEGRTLTLNPMAMKKIKKNDPIKVCKGDVCVETGGAEGQIMKVLVILILVFGLLKAAKNYLN